MSKFFNNSCNERASKVLQEERKGKDDNDKYSGRNFRIRKVKIANLTLKQERELLKIAKEGKGKAKKDAINLLIYYSQKIVKYIARGYSSLKGKVEYEDLIAEGISSLPKAIENQLISQGSSVKERKNLVFYDSSYRENDKDNKSYSLADTLDDSENADLDMQQIRQKDTIIQINNLINSLTNREEILLIRLWHKITPTNLFDIYCLATEEEKEELRKKMRLSEKFDPSSLQKYSLGEKKNSSLPVAKKYLDQFTEKYKSSDLVKLLNKSENAVRRLKQEKELFKVSDIKFGLLTTKNKNLYDNKKLDWIIPGRNFYSNQEKKLDMNFFTTASSDFLTSFLPGEDAFIIGLLARKKFDLLGKTAMDEFACGGTGLLANTGIITNPHNSQHITGGSSSGSAVAVIKKMVSFSLGSDTGGSVRQPAAYCGAIGFKPSQGAISRYGLIPLASSLDTVGILTDSAIKAKEVFSIISQPDPSDLLTIASKKKSIKPVSFSSAKKVAILKGIESPNSEAPKVEHSSFFSVGSKTH
nr:7945_t:CDS:2 [Entrophospora candida]